MFSCLKSKLQANPNRTKATVIGISEEDTVRMGDPDAIADGVIVEAERAGKAARIAACAELSGAFGPAAVAGLGRRVSGARSALPINCAKKLLGR
jgi:hypothetical protein